MDPLPPSRADNPTVPPGEAFKQTQAMDGAALNLLRKQASTDPETFWGQLARRHLAWHRPFQQTLDASAAPHYTWFAGGELNVSFNCLDRHLLTCPHKVAIIYEGERGDLRTLTYRALHQEVCRLANGLAALGLCCGDRVVILLPNIPEAVIAMQACARLGIIHSVVFGGFAADSLRDRIEDAQARAVITADGFHRGGKFVDLKRTVDSALQQGCDSIENVLVVAHSGVDVPMQPPRDRWYHDSLLSDVCAPVWVPSEHPLFVLYTSGSTGKPKGIVHSSAGYLLGCLTSLQWVFDLQPQDIYWCTADVGWITGHSYVAYGPLALGATQVMYEGAPNVPHGGRFWEICERHRVSIFYTAPTAIRSLMRLGEELVARYDLSRLRLLGSVGEPINPEAWLWYQRVIGQQRCPIVDTWWQTETGSVMIAPIPGVVATKPGSCTLPLPGVAADIVDEQGNSVTAPGQSGFLVIKKPWPSMIRTIWNDDVRYVSAYWQKFEGQFYFTGDGAHRDSDGYFWISGRIDDVLNVSGHRLGTMEIESALLSHPQVTEAAVVGRQDAIRGEAIFAYVVLRGPLPEGQAATVLCDALKAWVGQRIGAIAKPADICFCGNLPKTRSGKIMRRVLRAIARGEPFTGDVSTLENATILQQIQAAKDNAPGNPTQ